MALWAELKRRNVFKIGTAYAIAAWLVADVATAVLPAIEAPTWIVQTIILLLALGFPVALLLAWVYEVTPEGIRRTSDVAPADSITPATGHRLNYAVGSLAGIAVAFIVADLVVDDPASGVADSAVAASSPSVEKANADATNGTIPSTDRLPNSVAVLPCANFSTDPNDEFFAASLHAELLDRLFKLRNLNVIARTSVLQYADAAQQITEIADELGVGAIMECNVAYGDGRIVVSANLINGDTGLQMWSERYNREFSDVFGIQSDIAANVAMAVGAQLSAEEQALIEEIPTESTVAYALFLQARQLIGLEGFADPAGVHALLDQAIAIDPEFALAHGLKAGLYSALLANTAGNDAQDPADLEPLIRRFAARALEIDPANPAGHAAMSNLGTFSWRWTEARVSSLRVIEARSPFQAGPVESIPFWFLSWSGNDEEAVQSAARASELSPLDWQGYWISGIVLNYAGRYDESVAALRKSADIVPAAPVVHTWLAYSELARGNNEAALRELQLTEQLRAAPLVIYLLDLAYCYGRLGDREKAQSLYDQIAAAAVDQDIGAGGRAIASMAIGDYEGGLRWLEVGAEKAARHEIDAGMFSLMNLKMNFTADPRLETPEFVAVRERLRGD